jgi:hypothetical protein
MFDVSFRSPVWKPSGSLRLGGGAPRAQQTSAVKARARDAVREPGYCLT